MASEYREIVFEPRELQAALRDHALQVNRAVPEDGQPMSVDAARKPAIRATLHLEHKRLTFDDQEIAAALITFASRHRMPVARRAQKAITVRDGRMVLELRMHTPWV